MDAAGETGSDEFAGVAAGVVIPMTEEEEEEERLKGPLLDTSGAYVFSFD